MSKRQLALYEGARISMHESIQLTVDSLNTYGPRFKHWAIAWSGGKDSSALVTLVPYLIDSGKVPRPESLTVFYADTRLELLPLWFAANAIKEELAEHGIDVRTVMAEMDKRFLVYILGRGVPPSNNMTFRWCTRQIKIDPMKEAIAGLHPGERILMLTGVRQGESAIRDGRIAMSCGRDGGECGQGWYQETLDGAQAATLAPLLHWRVCHIWEWLKHWAPSAEFGDWSTATIADAYGGDEAEEINARTGCVGCPLAQNDTALDAVLMNERWTYLRPLKELRPLYRELRLPESRLRQPGGERRKDGTLVDNQHRMGPIKMDARKAALARVLDIQARVNADANRLGRPRVDVLNDEEVARICQLHNENTWPEKWTGNEPGAEQPFIEETDQLGLWGAALEDA